MIRRILAATLPRILALVLALPPIYAVTAVFLRSALVAGWPPGQAATIACGVIAAVVVIVAALQGLPGEAPK